MKKPWSLSTTIRNPERILPFLRVLEEMEGENFDVEGQVKFQTLLIKNRLYHPRNLPERLDHYYEIEENTMSFDQATEIFNFMKTQSRALRDDPGLRGRTSVSPLTQKGLAIAKESRGPVIITDLGKEFLDKEDIGSTFFYYFIKWQLPNPLDGYSSDDGYDIKPFLATLSLIKKVNEKMTSLNKKAKGLSKQEFSLFVPTLICVSDVNSSVDKIIELRNQQYGKSRIEKNRIFSDFRKNFLKDWLGTEDNEEIERNIHNLKDYGDTILRNFRLTRYLYIRGNGYYVDLEPRRLIEIEEMLSTLTLESKDFESEDDYIDYLGDNSLPELPWNNITDLKRIAEALLVEINELEESLSIVHKESPEYHTSEEAQSAINSLREYRHELQGEIIHKQSQQLENIKQYIEGLKNIYQQENKSLMLEKYSALGLYSLNDADKIKPNYSVGDDNQPIFTAPAGKPDIECFYESFNAICEVTMLRGRDQWYNEGQPVMRHLRDFEERNQSKPAYCIFIAPSVHRDTINTFWNSIKYGFEDERTQKIVPLSINDFLNILDTLVIYKGQGRTFTHEMLESLYDRILEETSIISSSQEWYSKIPEFINNWKEEILR